MNRTRTPISRAALCALALTAALQLVGCRGHFQERVTLEAREKPKDAQTSLLPAHERLTVHPVVLDELLRHPALPFAFGHHMGIGDPSLRSMAAARELSALLGKKGAGYVSGAGTTLAVWTLGRAKLLYGAWLASGPGQSFAKFVVDLGAVDGALRPGAELDRTKVRAALKVIGEQQ